MRQTKFTTQVYSLFGAGYVLEAHDPARCQKRAISWTQTPGEFCCRFLGHVLRCHCSHDVVSHGGETREVWAQQTPASVLKLPGGFGVDEPVY